jgi:hypothetical protein
MNLISLSISASTLEEVILELILIFREIASVLPVYDGGARLVGFPDEAPGPLPSRILSADAEAVNKRP